MVVMTLREAVIVLRHRLVAPEFVHLEKRRGSAELLDYPTIICMLLLELNEAIFNLSSVSLRVRQEAAQQAFLELVEFETLHAAKDVLSDLRGVTVHVDWLFLALFLCTCLSCGLRGRG